MVLASERILKQALAADVVEGGGVLMFAGFSESRDTRGSPGGGAVQNETAGRVPQEPGMLGRRNAVPVVFWEALNPIERDAFRSFAFPRTFAAGARLIQEGDQADYVIVILSGKTKIYVEEHGRERVLAVRGPGQLVGERGVLRLSVRSASVMALETVQALVARSRDFAFFITDHPRVLDIVERQVHEQFTEDSAPHPQVLAGENCTIMLSDVVGFGAVSRNDEDRRLIREALFGMTHTVLQDLPDAWSWEDRGDGLLTVVSPGVPTGRVLAHLHKELPAALEEHNRVYPGSARIQLRVAVDVGPVASDRMGVSGEAIITTARLVEAPAFKAAMTESGASLGVVASRFIYESVIRHGPYLEGYSEIRVEVKESSTVAWMKLFDRPLAGSWTVTSLFPGFLSTIIISDRYGGELVELRLKDHRPHQDDGEAAVAGPPGISGKSVGGRPGAHSHR